MLKQLTTFAIAFAIAGAAQAQIPVYGFVVKNTYPHDTGAFTQGLMFHKGYLYESTGQYNQSTLRKVDLKSGKVLQKTQLPGDVFGEGATVVGNQIVSLTWTSQVGYVFDIETLQLKQNFHYVGEGWGLASDARQVYMSDGSSFIRVLDPKTLKETRRMQVTADGQPVTQLNELEMVDGELFANVWGTDRIARINRADGKVTGWIDLTGLLPPEQRGTSNVDAVLNGIAYDRSGRRLYVTGKLWPKLFEIELVPKLRR